MVVALQDVLAGVGPRLRELRGDEGSASAVLATRTGMTAGTLSRLEAPCRTGTGPDGQSVTVTVRVLRRLGRGPDPDPGRAARDTGRLLGTTSPDGS